METKLTSSPQPAVLINLDEYLHLKRVEKSTIKNSTRLDLQFSVLIFGQKELRSEDVGKIFEAVSDSVKHIGKFEVDWSRKRIEVSNPLVSG